jgi:hypothetical protein
MFTLDLAIDTIQTGKKTFVNTVFAGNQTIAKALNEFVDAQTSYTKGAVKAATNVATTLSSEAVKSVEDLKKWDMTKAFAAK